MIRCKYSDCNRKIPLAMRDVCLCRCKGTYCHEHRHDHDCEYDYYSAHQKKLEEKLTQVLPEKVIKV